MPKTKREYKSRIARISIENYDVSAPRESNVELKTRHNACYYAQQTLSSQNIIIANMKFVDRIEESERLTKALDGDNTSFVVVYGRRRLGKSVSTQLLFRPCQK